MEKVKLIVTLGPSTRTEADLRKLKAKGVDFVRINMSHSSVEDLRYFIALSKKVGIPFILDTEGSQIRTGRLQENSIVFAEGDEVCIHAREIIGDRHNISLRPEHIVHQLEAGDILYIDFESLAFLVTDTEHAAEGYITAKAINPGRLGNNKAVVVDSTLPKEFDLPPLSPKDYQSIDIGLGEGVGHIAASFMRSGAFVDAVREATKGAMKIISKIECIDGLKHLDEIIEKSDAILIDRGDLSKEIPIEKIPFAQKIILAHAKRLGKPVLVATNMLETMVEKDRPTRAEVHDVIATVLDGASGVALSAETAVGKHPMECVNTMQSLLRHAALAQNFRSHASDDAFVDDLERSGYLLDTGAGETLIGPHGGKLVERIAEKPLDAAYLETLPRIPLGADLEMDVEQIATGVFSPLEGFMGKKDVESVLEKGRLANGVVWPIPVVLDVPVAVANSLRMGEDVLLLDARGESLAILHVAEKYEYNRRQFAQKLYATLDENHPGVQKALAMHPIFVAGPINLISRRKAEFSHYALTPRQVRRLFRERHWQGVVGFHTRNAIHRSHEHIQLKALEDEHCDGLFVHPVVGSKKPGDYHAAYIIKSYERMMNGIYPKDKVAFATFNTYSRYAGPREALFTAICRQNYGCSHFVVGRDHTGVGNFYPHDASHKIFDEFPDIQIKPVRFHEMFYSRQQGDYVHAPEVPDYDSADKLSISGTEARRIFKRGGIPPEWFMRPEIAQIIADAIRRGEEVFVRKDDKGTVIWFTGLSGSGKSTVAGRLKDALEMEGKKVAVIDGDDIRREKHKHLGFSREDIRENNRLIAELAREKVKELDFVFVPIISPYREDRAMARSIIGDGFVELFINASLAKCIERDPKGLYKKALAGEISDFIGISASNPYEPPEAPEIEIRSDRVAVDAAVDQVLQFLKTKQI